MSVFKAYAVGILAVLLVTGFLMYTHHERAVGEQKIEKQDATVVAKAEVHNAVAEATQVAADSKAEKALNDALQNPVDSFPPIPVSVQQPAAAACPSTVSHPRGTTAQSQPATTVRTEAPARVVQPDWKAVERSDVQSAHDADAEIIYLQGLLKAQYALCSR